MSTVMLEHIRMTRESKSFTDSLHAVLTAAGLFEGPKYLLSGLTGMAFKFTVHERLLPLSVSAYGQWGIEHCPAVDNLGLFTEWDGGRTRHPTFEVYRRDSVEWIKSSLNRGIGVIYWIPEFGVIRGYDDEDGVFFVQDGWSAEDRVVLYDNFGLNFTEFWYCRTFGGKVATDPAETALESIRLAADDWDTPYKTLPNTDIASGRLAYDFLIRALEKGGYDEGGAVYILDSYIHARDEIAQYLYDVRDLLPGLGEPAQLYAELRQLLPHIERCTGADSDSAGRRILKDRTNGLTRLLREAKMLEDRAVRQFRAVSERYPDRKRTTVPRWGAHSPR